jgi:hypothetical protein
MLVVTEALDNGEAYIPSDVLALYPLASSEVAADRSKICGGCDRLFKPTWTCKECGCFMKIKVRLAGQHCPLHKWEAVGES